MQQTINPHRKRSWVWIAGLLLSTIMLVCVHFFFGMRFDTIDDTVILRQMMGFGVEEIPDFNMYVSFVLFAVLRWLSILFPGLPWFSYMQLFLIWLSATVIAKSIIQCFSNEDRPIWQGTLLAFIFLLVFILRYESRVTYTVTAGLLGAAAVAQLLSIDTRNCTNGQWIGSAMLSLILILFSYSLRQQAMLPALPFCFLAFCVQGANRCKAGKPWKYPLIATALIVVLSLGIVMGLRAWEINTKPGIREYVEWQDARIRIWDYLGIGNTPQDTLAKFDISNERLALLQEWYQMDGDLDTPTLLALGDAIEAARSRDLLTLSNTMFTCVTALFKSDPILTWSLLVLGCMLTGTLLFSFIGNRKEKKTLLVGQLLGLFFLILLTLYLAYKERINLRGFLTIMLPFASLTVCLLCQSLPKAKTYKTTSAIACTALLLTTVLYCVPFFESHIRKPPTAKELATEAVLIAIDEYAAANEDYLLIYDGTLAIDTRMFPSTKNGFNKNVHLWGGWNLHSPAYNAMLEAYGFDPDHWSIEDFLSYDVRLLRRNAAAPELLLNALNESSNVEYFLEEGSNGLYVISFEEW